MKNKSATTILQEPTQPNEILHVTFQGLQQCDAIVEKITKQKRMH